MRQPETYSDMNRANDEQRQIPMADDLLKQKKNPGGKQYHAGRHQKDNSHPLLDFLPSTIDLLTYRRTDELRPVADGLDESENHSPEKL